MNVSEALGGSPFDFYYRRKFDRIIEKADIGDLDLSQDWYEIRRRINVTTSFNLWGLVFGGLWAVYRGVPYAFLVILIAAGTIAAPYFIDANEGILRALSYGMGAVFGLYGNSWLLNSYLSQMREYGDEAIVERETRPSLLHAFLAISILGITGIVAETPADELKILAVAVLPIQEQSDELAVTTDVITDVSSERSENFWESAREKWNEQCISKGIVGARQAASAWTQGAYRTFPGLEGKVEDFCGCIFDQIQDNMTRDEWRALEQGHGVADARKKLSFYMMACDSTLD